MPEHITERSVDDSAVDLVDQHQNTYRITMQITYQITMQIRTVLRKDDGLSSKIYARIDFH